MATHFHPRPTLSCFATKSPLTAELFVSQPKLYYPELDDQFSEGLQLKRQLQDSGQRNWGFTTFRCTYDDDRVWNRFMDILNERAREPLEFYDTHELLKNLEWRVQSDRALLDGASKAKVRRIFRDWAAGAAGPKEKYAPHYRHCVRVDHDSLKLVVHDAPHPPAPDLKPIGHVNIICCYWTFGEDEEDDGEDELEGCTQTDVG